jgi:hypothetical protein
MPYTLDDRPTMAVADGFEPSNSRVTAERNTRLCDTTIKDVSPSVTPLHVGVTLATLLGVRAYIEKQRLPIIDYSLASAKRCFIDVGIEPTPIAGVAAPGSLKSGAACGSRTRT